MAIVMLPPLASTTSCNLLGNEAHAFLMNSSDMLFQARVIDDLSDDTLEWDTGQARSCTYDQNAKSRGFKSAIVGV